MSIVACPKCQEEVSLPPRVPKEAIVRCPLCCEQYILSEALSTLPPQLEIVELPVGYRAEEELAATHALAGVGAGASGSYSRAGFGTDVAEPESDEFSTGAMEESSPGFESETSLHPTGPSVKRQLLHPPGSRKKKAAGSPIGTLIAIMFGGAMAIPCALLLLLWLPKEYHKDPFNVAPMLNQYAPYLLPEHLQKTASASPMKPSADRLKTKPANKTENEAEPADKTATATKDEEPNKEPGGLDFGNKFDNALKGVTEPAPNDVAANSTEETKLPEVPNIPEPNLSELPGVDPEMKKEPMVPENPTGSSSEENEGPVAPAPNLAKVRQAREQLENKLTEYDIAAAGTDNEARKAAIRAMYQAGASMASILPKGNIGVEDVFDGFLADPKKLNYAGVLAPSTLDAETRENDGILLFGTVKSCRQGSSLCEVNLEVTSRDKRVITVIGPEMTEGSTYFVAGKILEEPSKLLSDYSSTSPRAVQALFWREAKP